MNKLSRIGALGFSHSGTQAGNVRLVFRAAMGIVTGCIFLFAEGCSTPDETPSKAEAMQEDTRLAKLQALVAEQLEVAEKAVEKKKWGEAAKAIAKVQEMDPDHPGDQELKCRVFWGPIPEKTAGDLRYKEHPTEPVCAISGVVDREAKTVVLPTQIEGRSVVRIGCGAFSWCDGLTSVTIPPSVTSIGAEAFILCYGLKSVTIPLGVTSIGEGAFSWCDGLTSVTIPPSVTSIGDGAFFLCHGLKSLTIPSSVTRIGDAAFGAWNLENLSVATDNPSYQSEGGVLFTKGGKTLIQYPIGKPGKSYIIPPNVTRIGKGAFAYCDSLTSVTIPASVTSIGEGAFEGCRGLKSVTLPKGVKIGEDAFLRCPWQPSE